MILKIHISYIHFFTFLLLLGNLLGAKTLVAQGSFVDYQPSYERYTPNYQIDKIEFTHEQTIIHLRFVKDNSRTCWYVENAEEDDDIIYEPIAITKIRRNGVMKKANLGDMEITLSSEAGKENVFTCQVHFQRLNPAIKKVHLVEGVYEKENENHFNYFDIHIINPG